MMTNTTTTTFSTQRFIIPINHGHTEIALHAFVSEPDETSLNYSNKFPLPPLVILFHGAGGDHYHFDTVLPVLVRSGFRVLTCDLRYHGESQPQQDIQDDDDLVFNMQTLCDDIHHVLVWLKNNKHQSCSSGDLIFGGLSMGGILAQTCVDQPTKWELLGYTLRGLIAIATPSIHMVWPRIAWMDVYRNAESIDPAILQAARQAISESAVHDDAKKEAVRAMALISDKALFQCLRSSADALPPVPTREQVPGFDGHPIRLRQLLITGQSDDHTVNVMSAWKKLSDGYQGEGNIDSVFEVIQDAGHMVPLDQGGLVGNAIVDMFRRN
ncbi:Alpha/Beta hydrolase protein [Zychaea mexicana]|uniref:Alpha/Beta hydrolase protein n=1 Tax=Zychaea mexicana TaxID=64656 RepID=UPI0022FECC60|nr:Alpha/Beta hydrolase protein [Zychaea mexicana]KAI9494807.1 Alpha/Beta hydrolase protein [Zychaea mexicana]